MSPSTKRIVLYTGSAVVAAAIGGLKVEMFGGVLAWPAFFFQWTLFVLSIGGTIFNTLRAYYDNTPEKETPPVPSAVVQQIKEAQAVVSQGSKVETKAAPANFTPPKPGEPGWIGDSSVKTPLNW